MRMQELSYTSCGPHEREHWLAASWILFKRVTNRVERLRRNWKEILRDEKGFLSFPEEGIFRGEDHKISENLWKSRWKGRVRFKLLPGSGKQIEFTECHPSKKVFPLPLLFFLLFSLWPFRHFKLARKAVYAIKGSGS